MDAAPMSAAGHLDGDESVQTPAVTQEPTPSDEREPRRRIRVLWLIKGLGRGGAEMLLYHAAELRDRDSFECEVAYLLGSRGWLAEDFRSVGVPVHLLPSERHADLRWAGKLRRFLIENPVDVVHVHSPLVAAVARLVVRTVPRAVRPVMVSTEHLPWSGHALPTMVVNALTFRLDDAHLAVSSAVVDSIPRRLRRNVRVLVHGVPVETIRAERRWRVEARAELGVADDEVLVGTVANFTPQKAYPDLLEAARRVIDRGRKVRFAVGGRGTLESEIRTLRDRLGLGDRFLVLGALEDAPRFMAACDIFALPSHWEGLPLVIMEAMAIGLPVVATKVGGITELVRDGVDGILVPKARPQQLADAIDELAKNPDRRRRMGREAADGAMRFDNHSAIRTIEALYRELVSARDDARGRDR
jgi:glycosyltransferase involved in cell wall biosynthesis